ncbi:MAG TPA: ABC transporter permease [Bryobacteraceae bacterium]|nr:ABC transporter permease [Bryobacteraceae bacterium]
MGERLSILFHRIKALFLRRRLDRDLEDELRFHMELLHEKNPTNRRFGNRASFQEACREMWTLGFIEILWQDIRYALRALRKSPGFAGVAIFVLALGIGANIAIFSVVNAVALKPLPYRDPSQLVLLWGNVRRANVERRGASYPDFVDWRKQSKSFVDMAAYSDVGSFLMGGDDAPERVITEYVSASYFSLLGVSPILGRTFLPSEDQVPMRDQVILLSEGVWKRRYGADPAIIGKTIQMSARTYTVVGVMPAGFRGLSDLAELWRPFMMSGTAENLAERGDRGMAILARLKPGVPLKQAQAELDTICRALERQYPGTNKGRGVEIAPLDKEIFGDIRPAALALLGAVTFVLLIACANVANLLLARSEARQREIALRVVLGAGRLRLWRQLLTESGVLAILGAAAGLLLAIFGLRVLMAASPVTLPSFVHAGIDPAVALFTVLISALCGVIMGLAPAIHSRLAGLHAAFKESSGRTSAGRTTRRFRNALVVAEVSLTLVLLIGAGLLIRSVRAIATIDPGFDPGHLLTVSISRYRGPQPDDGSPSPTKVSIRQILDRIRTLPSVQSAEAATDVPLSGTGAAIFYTAEGQQPVTDKNRPRAYIHRITPGFFEALHAKLVAGRTFSAEEMENDSGVVIVSENVAKRFWPGQDPINKRMKGGAPDSSSPWRRIVGVVGEMKYRGLPENPTADPDIYRPLPDLERDILLLVRTPLDPASLSGAVRNAIHDVDRSIPVYSVATLDERIGKQTARNRFTGWLMGIFAGVALLLAVVGIYGVMSYMVTRRTQEIGVRMALGANRAQVLFLVVGQGLPLIVGGILVGLAVSFSLTRALATLLYNVTPTDTLTFAAVTALLLLIALLACCLPALRASRIDPLQALRHE